MHHTNLRQIRAVLNKIPLRRASPVVFVHSGLFPFGHLEGGVEGLHKLLLNWIGPEGTLLMPAFTFRSNDVWDHENTPSEMGVLTEYFRKLPDTHRTIHPLHSVSVSGKFSEFFTSDIEPSSFGNRSTFAKLAELEAINISLGTEFVGGATYLHYLEELVQVHYREYIEIKKKIICSDDNDLPDHFIFFARKKDHDYEWENSWGHVLIDFLLEGLLTIHRVGPAKIMWSDINLAGGFLLSKLHENSEYCAVRRAV